MRMYPAQQLAQLADVACRHGVLLIVDEVMTGGGRTGHLSAHRAAGIAPDLICASKTLAGGLLPLAATLASPSLAAAWDTPDRTRTFFHGHSFTAHPLACAVAVANWKMLTTAPSPAPRRMELFWNEALAPLRSLPMVRDVRVCGTIAAVELNLPGGYLAAVGRQLRLACLAAGSASPPAGPGPLRHAPLLHLRGVARADRPCHATRDHVARMTVLECGGLPPLFKRPVSD